MRAASSWGLLALLFDLSALMLDLAFQGQRWTRIPGLALLGVALACGTMAILQARGAPARERMAALLLGGAGVALALLLLLGALLPQSR